MSKKQSDAELDEIEVQFIDEWNRGKRPTLADYIAKYPHYEEELTQFVLLFAVSETATPDTQVDAEPSPVAETLVERVLAADRSRAQTLNQRLKEIGKNPVEFAREMDLPDYIVAELQARRLMHLPHQVIIALSRKFCQTVEQIKDLVDFRPPVNSLAFQMRATKPDLTHVLQAHTFREAMLLCQEKGLATAEQVKKWLDEEKS